MFNTEPYKQYIKEDSIDMIEVAKHYFGIKKFPFKLCSPIREDKHPSCSMGLRQGQVYMHDFTTGESYHIVRLLQLMWGLDRQSTLERIVNDLMLNINQGSCCTGIRRSKISEARPQIGFEHRKWQAKDTEYWESYGCKRELVVDANIWPIKTIIIDNGQNIVKKPADEYAYAFVENKEGKQSVKIYQPFNKDGWKWRSSHDKSVLALWTLLPESGDIVVICSSVKDAICLTSQTGIPAIAVQGEGMDVSNTAMNILKKRFTIVCVCFDSDDAGVANAQKLSKKHGITNIELPHYEFAKDISDFYKNYGKETFRDIMNMKFGGYINPSEKKEE